ncbi:NAD(P)H-dependent oxidoreductase [Marinobacter gelidimuriae]|uniref:NAD(P)H-dependent oxidoreductase n=1 Tax=Marinobacter gelidimuriae TaxID=2739064 RepID=UPI003899443A
MWPGIAGDQCRPGVQRRWQPKCGSFTAKATDSVNDTPISQHDRASLQAQFILSEQLIGELKNADTLVLAAPMYNFRIPATLKQWIDSICRAGVSEVFHIDASGSKGTPDQVIAQGKQ